MSQPPFGKRRAATINVPPAVGKTASERIAAPPTEAVATPTDIATALSVDEELRAWKEERRRGLLRRIPWRQISLMASLSFGAASFVLPDTVNHAVDWLLYALAAVSFGVWLTGRSKRPSQ